MIAASSVTGPLLWVAPSDIGALSLFTVAGIITSNSQGVSMSGHTKIFEYQENGLSYTVTVYEQDGAFFADVRVNEGAMDVNAVYFGDDDLSGTSDSLKGPLNMNGGGAEYEGEPVQWDTAFKLSDPGLGQAGTDKETYVSEGDTLTISLPITSLDDIDFFGIRATSTTTDEGSIKAVSGDPETPEDPDDETYDKVFFDFGENEAGVWNGGVYILSEEPDPNVFNVPALPDGTEPTFDNYLAYFEEIGGEIASVDSVVFYDVDADGVLQQTLRIEAPEGGFADAAAVQDAYDAAIAEMNDAEAGAAAPAAESLEEDPEQSDESSDLGHSDLLAALTIDIDAEDEFDVDEAEETEEFALV